MLSGNTGDDADWYDQKMSRITVKGAIACVAGREVEKQQDSGCREKSMADVTDVKHAYYASIECGLRFRWVLPGNIPLCIDEIIVKPVSQLTAVSSRNALS